MTRNQHIKKQKDIKDLIESNLKQRVVGNPNPIKLGRCFDFLRDYYGIREGSTNKKGDNRIGEPNNSVDKINNQQDLASTYNISPDTMENYIKLSKSIPELANLVETGTVTKTTALAIMKNLSEMEQEDLIQHLDVTKKYTQKQVEEYIAQLKSKDDKVKQLESENQKLTTTTQDLIETNIRQRGDVGGSAKKVGRRIKELERLYGIEHGSNQHGHEKNSYPQKTQEDIAKQMDMDTRTLRNYKQLSDMIPELDDLVTNFEREKNDP